MHTQRIALGAARQKRLPRTVNIFDNVRNNDQSRAVADAKRRRPGSTPLFSVRDVKASRALACRQDHPTPICIDFVHILVQSFT